MEANQSSYTITQLSKILKVTDHTLRYYEKEFGLNVPKDSRGRRYYTSEIANIFWQIKRMRDEGLEIKAIRKILISKNIIPANNETHPVPAQASSKALEQQTKNMDLIFAQFRQQLLSSVIQEISCAKEDLIDEIYRSKLELGACVENNFRRLESKMEKHFNRVDQQLTKWREKTRKKKFPKLFLI